MGRRKGKPRKVARCAGKEKETKDYRSYPQGSPRGPITVDENIRLASIIVEERLKDTETYKGFTCKVEVDIKEEDWLKFMGSDSE